MTFACDEYYCSIVLICLVLLCVLRDRWHLHQPKAIGAWRRDHPRNGYETFLWHQACPLGRWGEGLICLSGCVCMVVRTHPQERARLGLRSGTQRVAVAVVTGVVCVLKTRQATLWLLQPHRLRGQLERCDQILALTESVVVLWQKYRGFFPP